MASPFLRRPERCCIARQSRLQGLSFAHLAFGFRRSRTRREEWPVLVSAKSGNNKSGGQRTKTKEKEKTKKKRKKEKGKEKAPRQEVLAELEKVKQLKRGIALQFNLAEAKASERGGKEVVEKKNSSGSGSGDVPMFPGGPGRPPKTAVDLLSKEALYKQIALVSKQMSKRLSEANLYIRHLEIDLLKRDEEIASFHERVSVVEEEFDHVLKSLRELSEVGLTQSGFGKEDHRQVDHPSGGDVEMAMDSAGNHHKQEERLRILQRSVEDLSQKLKNERETLTYIRKVSVPISWLGVAEDVKLMGSFDGWTSGQQLSPTESVSGGQMEFSAELLLRPGVYEVKFLVDGRWQLASEWPLTGRDPLSSNNILVVEIEENQELN